MGDITGERVQILLALHNGERDLRAQLDSLAAQDHTAWDLTVGDDGSSDAGPQIVADFATAMAEWGRRVILQPGPEQGFVANFLTLLAQSPKQTRWVAFCDQDDVWLPDRLARGLQALAALPKTQPALYCSRTWVTDQDLQHRRLSRRNSRPPRFRNALVQNVAAGNTILLNPAAVQLLREAGAEAAKLPGLAAHDWWAYQLVTGAGGVVIHDTKPTLLYRQHPGNQIGANLGWRSQMMRLRMMWGGRFADWNAANLRALDLVWDQLTPENRALVSAFKSLRNAPFLTRIKGIWRLGLYRQNALAHAGLWLAVMVGKL